MFDILATKAAEGVEKISSAELGRLLGVPAYIVRKDISYLGGTGHQAERGYTVRRLMERIDLALGLNRKRKLCIVGLGRLGAALIHYGFFGAFEVAAGFDKSLNRIELLKTDTELFAVGRLEEVVRAKSIDVGVVAVPAPSAQEVTDRLVGAGVRGILNFAPVNVKVPENVARINIDLNNALRVIAAGIASNEFLWEKNLSNNKQPPTAAKEVAP